MTLTLLLWLTLVALTAFLLWWEMRYKDVVIDYTAPRPLPVEFRAHHWFPRLLLRLSVKDPSRRARIRKAVTVPSVRRVGIVVLVSGDELSAEHEAHEVAGHGAQVVLMGPVEYLFTYVWHYMLRSGSWANHIMERNATLRGREMAQHFTGQTL